MKKELEGLVCGKAANFICVLPHGSKHLIWIRVGDARHYRVGGHFVGRI